MKPSNLRISDLKLQISNLKCAVNPRSAFEICDLIFEIFNFKSEILPFFNHIGPLIPPSLRTRQKWIMIRSETASGMATQCNT